MATKDTFKADHSNYIFFWKHQLSLDLFSFVSCKWASFFSALFSDRRTSTSHAIACTQRSLEHLGVPLPQAIRSELRKQVKGHWYYTAWKNNDCLGHRASIVAWILVAFLLRTPPQEGISQRTAFNSPELASSLLWEPLTHLQFGCFELCPIHTSSQLSKSICDCCCHWFLYNPFLCSSIGWEHASALRTPGKHYSATCAGGASRPQLFLPKLKQDLVFRITWHYDACKPKATDTLRSCSKLANVDMVHNLPNDKCTFTPSARHKTHFWIHIWINQSMLVEFLWWIHSGMYTGSTTQEYETWLYCDIWL